MTRTTRSQDPNKNRSSPIHQVNKVVNHPPKTKSNYLIMNRLQVSSVSLMMSLLLQFLLLSSIATNTITHAQECAPNGNCDTHPRCPVWKDEGECTKSATYMKKYCPVSCGYAKTPEKTAEEIVEESTQFGVKQEAVGDSKEQTLGVIRSSIEYMKEPRDVHSCKNKHEYCSFWVTVGECENNPGWMQHHCGPACGNC